MMWEHLKQEQKEKYKTLITNFASLSEAFSQKAEGEDSDDRESYVAPIVNSKFQETVFQKAFHAVGGVLHRQMIEFPDPQREGLPNQQHQR